MKQTSRIIKPIKTAYGFDISGHETIVVRSTRRGKNIDHASVSVSELDLNNAKSIAVGALPTYASFARRLTVPMPSINKAQKVIPSLLDIQLPYPLEKCVYQITDMRITATRQTEALALAARHEDLTAFINQFQKQGIDPAFLDHEALALWEQSLAEKPLAIGDQRAVVYLGHERSTLVLGNGERFIAAQGSRSGSQQFSNETTLQSFIHRAQQFIRATLAENAEQPVQWAFTGPGATDEKITGAFRQAVTRPDKDIAFTHAEPRTFLARALTNRVLKVTSTPCNFRQPPFEHAQLVRLRNRYQNKTLITCFVAALFTCGINLGWLQLLKTKNREMQQQLTAAAQTLTSMKNIPKGQEVVVVERALEEEKAKLAPFLETFSDPLTDNLANLLNVAQDAQLTIETLSLRKQTMLIAGRSSAWPDSEILEQHLKTQGWSPTLERNEADATDRIPFTLKGAR